MQSKIRPPGWQMRSHDRHYVGDFDGNGREDLWVFNGDQWAIAYLRKDLYVFNGHDCAIAYLGMLRSTGAALSMQARYDGNVPGWQMRRHDQHYVCDVKGDGREDLFVYNHQDWGPEYLGVLFSNGTSLKGR